MNHLKAFLCEDDGVGVVEIVLIIVVLIALVMVFRDRIKALVENIFKTIDKNVKNV